MAEHNKLGKWGEQIAVDHLAAKGYAIVDCNWKLGDLELDIIAMKDSRIIFVEVKTRSTSAVDPALAVNARRRARMVRAANAYVKAYNIPHEVQFDVVLIIGHYSSPIPPQIEHISDAFFPPLRTIR